MVHNYDRKKIVVVVVIDILILSTLPINIRLGWKSLPVRNTLAYHGTELVTTVKKCSSLPCP
jgi:hypothetical protein